jgi:hypothetical protein
LKSYSGETHDIGFSSGQSEKPWAVAPDQDGWTGFLDRLNGDGVAAHSIVLAHKAGSSSLKKGLDYRHCLSQSINPRCPTIKSEARFIVFGSNAAGPQAKLKTSVRQEIDCRSFTRDEHGIAKIVVKNIRSNPKMFSGLGGTDQCWYWSDDVGEMIRNG